MGFDNVFHVAVAGFADAEQDESMKIVAQEAKRVARKLSDCLPGAVPGATCSCDLLLGGDVEEESTVVEWSAEELLV